MYSAGITADSAIATRHRTPACPKLTLTSRSTAKPSRMPTLIEMSAMATSAPLACGGAISVM
jgi:hypothetical protein